MRRDHPWLCQPASLLTQKQINRAQIPTRSLAYVSNQSFPFTSFETAFTSDSHPKNIGVSPAHRSHFKILPSRSQMPNNQKPCPTTCRPTYVLITVVCLEPGCLSCGCLGQIVDWNVASFGCLPQHCRLSNFLGPICQPQESTPATLSLGMLCFNSLLIDSPRSSSRCLIHESGR